MPTFARKRFGQHFLHDGNMIRKIIQAIAPQKNDVMIEIGPGHGAITKPLLAILDHLTVIEIDRDLVANIHHEAWSDHLTVIQQDVLRVDFQALAKDKKLRIIGNLPYNISTPLLFHLLKYSDIIADMTFMLQHEVAERIAAKVNSDAYGRLSVILQYYFSVDYLFSVSPNVFCPPPKVDSAIIQLRPYAKNPWEPIDGDLLEKTVKIAFQYRRKTLANNFKGYLKPADWDTIGLDPRARAETLSIPNFITLAKHLLF